MFASSSLRFQTEPSYNPCLGCMSMSCAKCTCAGDNRHHWTDELTKAPHKRARKKSPIPTKS